MSIFGNIMSAIFGGKSAQAGQTAAPSPQSTTPAANAPAAQATAEKVDVEAVLNDLASKNSEKLNWRTSIVDLMKLLKLDSSLSARKELAKELGYTGSTDDSAAMNIWLHKQVMKKLAENGGKVPADLH
ncbi:MAG TPA: DUF3597 domain-containing protein [Xanthobacteraceae bacterium]|nr:DUF3597 domain-containing protein [Xanthobacteraceae bacterium]